MALERRFAGNKRGLYRLAAPGTGST